MTFSACLRTIFAFGILIYGTCCYNLQRITADAALNHEWFREVPLPKSKDFMPTFPAQHAQDRYLNLQKQ